MSPGRQGRPSLASWAAEDVATNDSTSVPSAIDTTDHAARSELLGELTTLARSLSGYLVLSVTVDDDGHRRTTIYRSAAACERAVQRARERGRHTEVAVCQLLPVGVVTALSGGGR